MGWGDSVGTSGRGGGYGAGHNSTGRGGGSGGSRSRGTGFDGRDTPGAPTASDGRRGASMGRDGGVAGSGGGEADSRQATTRGTTRANSAGRTNAQGLATKDGVSQAGINAARGVAGMSGSITGGTVADMADMAERSFMDRAHTVDQGQGLATDMGPSVEAMSPEERNAHFSGLESAVQQTASPGLLGRAASFAAGYANPLAGMAVDTLARAHDASQQLSQVNDDFGTSLNDSYASSVGQQAKGAAGGMAGGKAGGLLGGRVGAAFGPIGAAAGTMIGSATGSSVGRSVAMGEKGYTGASPSTNVASSGRLSPSGGPRSEGGGNSQGGGATMVASAPTVTTPSGNTRPNYGPVDFKGYGSYAEKFFS